MVVIPATGLSIGCKFYEQGPFFVGYDILALRWVWNASVIIKKFVLEIIPFDGFQIVRPALIQMVDERSRIVFGAKVGFPKVFVGRFEAKVKVEAVAEDKDYLTVFCHELQMIELVEHAGDGGAEAGFEGVVLLVFAVE